MVCQSVKFALLLGAIIAVSVSPVRADGVVVTAPNCGSCGSAMRTIVECVPETYIAKKTTYKIICKTEEYQACKLQCVPEVRERTCCVVKRVPVMTTECRKVCKLVTVNETRTTMKTCYKTVKEIKQERRLVTLGHWECREWKPLVNLTGLFHNDCDPCAKPVCAPCPRTYKVWVCCPQYQCCPVEVCKRVCYQVPVTCVVPVCKRIETNETYQRCTYKCVTENVCSKVTVNVLKRVPYTCTRQVRCCVPVSEDVTCTRMVRRCRQVPCESCNTCNTGCGCGLGLFTGGLFRHNGDCCR